MKYPVNYVNGLQDYLRKIGEYDIYTQEEEQEIFKRLREGETDLRDDIDRMSFPDHMFSDFQFFCHKILFPKSLFSIY